MPQTGKSIFFYNTEVVDGNITDLRPGDIVSFFTQFNKKKQTMAAVRVKKQPKRWIVLLLPYIF